MKLMLLPFTYGDMNGHTADALLREVGYAREKGVKLWQDKSDLPYRRVADDALISRSRSRALTEFLRSDCDACVMIDHDIQWEAGAAVQLADRAVEKKAMVGGMYATRAKGRGIAGRLKEEAVRIVPGADKFYEAEYLATGFLAIPRVVAEEVLQYGRAAAALLNDERGLRALVDSFGGSSDGVLQSANLAVREVLDWDPRVTFFDFFRCISIPSTMKPGAFEFLSEDWSFSFRARQANPKRPQLLWSKPLLAHWGQYGFTLLEAQHAVAPATLLPK